MDWALTQEEMNLPILVDEAPPVKKRRRKVNYWRSLMQTPNFWWK